jgi:hypothetical protein
MRIGTPICLALAGSIACQTALAQDEASIRARLVKMAELSSQSALPMCIDVAWEVRNKPQIADAELNRRWNEVQARPDHPDASLLRHELALRTQDMPVKTRLLIGTNGDARISMERPIPGLQQDGKVASMLDVQNAGTATYMPFDAAMNSESLWQGTVGGGLGIMTPGFSGHENPSPLIENELRTARRLMFGGTERSTQSALANADPKMLSDGRFEVALALSNNQIGRLRGTWSTDLQSPVVAEFVQYTDEKSAQSNRPIARIRFDSWRRLDGSDLLIAGRMIREVADADGGDLRVTEEVSVVGAKVAECDFVESTAKTPKIVESTDRFKVNDPIRGDWTVEGLLDYRAGRNVFYTEPGKMVDASMGDPRNYSAREPRVESEYGGNRLSSAVRGWSNWWIAGAGVIAIVMIGAVFARHFRTQKGI